MTEENPSPNEINSTDVESDIDQYSSGHLPLLGRCEEVHTSNAPSILPLAGEADEHERKLFAAPWER